MRTGKHALRLFVVIQQEAVRERFQKLLNDGKKTGQLEASVPSFDVDFLTFEGPAVAQLQQETVDGLDRHYAQADDNAAILISDMLVEQVGYYPQRTWKPTSFAGVCQDHFRDRLYATISLMPEPQKVLDIDRTIGFCAGAPALLSVLGLVAGRLSYLARPEKSQALRSANVDVRLIKTSQSEFKMYFELRYQIYRPMGYLSLEVEDCVSQMEMNWCDKKSDPLWRVRARRRA